MRDTALFYIDILAPLYEDVQSSGIFADSKYFVDCIPLAPVAEILAAYQKNKNETGFDIQAFVASHFLPPAEPETGYSSDGKNIHEHLDGLWNLLARDPDEQRGTLVPLPYPYIVPGGRFREVYYWDSYFTLLGLQVSGRTDMIEYMVDNFAYLVNRFGFIPNGNRTYYLGRSQPPFFAWMVSLLAEEKGETILSRYLPELEKEYAFWMDGADRVGEDETAYRRVARMPDGTLVNRYWDDQDTPRPEAFTEDTHIAKQSGRLPSAVFRDIRAAAESGWDFSGRWFRDGSTMTTIQTTQLVPVDLNCLLFFMENLLARIYQPTNPEKHSELIHQAGRRRTAILNYCWDEEKGCFFDYHLADKQMTGIYTLATVFPLFCRLATSDQSLKIARLMEDKFLYPGGLTTTLNNTGQQWDAPNGWAPLQWITFQGLRQYGHMDLAETIRNNWLRNNERVFDETGKMMEKYNVMNTDTVAGGGEYPNQDGFGWTNGVYLKMKKSAGSIQ